MRSQYVRSEHRDGRKDSPSQDADGDSETGDGQWIGFHFTPISRILRGRVRVLSNTVSNAGATWAVGTISRDAETRGDPLEHLRGAGRRSRELKEFRERYNNMRPHWAPHASPNEDPCTPSDAYVQGPRTDHSRMATMGSRRAQNSHRIYAGLPRSRWGEHVMKPADFSIFHNSRYFWN